MSVISRAALTIATFAFVAVPVSAHAAPTTTDQLQVVHTIASSKVVHTSTTTGVVHTAATDTLQVVHTVAGADTLVVHTAL